MYKRQYQSNPERQRAQLAEVASLKAQLSWSPQDGVNHVSGFIAEPHPLPEYGWSLLSDILSALRDDVEQTGARFAVVLLPVPIQAGDLRLVTGGPLEHRFQTPTGSFTFRAAEPRDRLLALCHERGIECLDPTSEFLALASTPEAAEPVSYTHLTLPTNREV